MVDYSRFDHIGESDEEESPPLRRPSAAAPVSRPAGPPPNVMEDLEDYFRRIEERQQARDEAMMASDGPPSVERLTAEQIEGLNRVKYEPFDASYAECSVCLEDFAASDDLIEMPCAAGHLFHKSCASEVLSRSVFCPLCRVDVREIVTATPESPVAEQRAAEQEPAEQVTPLSPRQLGWAALPRADRHCSMPYRNRLRLPMAQYVCMPTVHAPRLTGTRETEG